MAESEILAAAVANMGAGADTVSTVLQALFYYLLRYYRYESLQLLREEVDGAGLSDILSYTEVQELPVLAACLKEAYCMHTPIGFGILRISNGAAVCGRYFPKGVILSVSPWVVHCHESIWGTDPETYNARRWLPQGKEDEERIAAMERYLIPFGSGYGTCPGKNLAHMEMLKTVSLVPY
jgi:cytochrome P450